MLPILHELLLERNVSHASEKLNLSQSATSDALGRLRDLFDDPLLIRAGKGMSITPFAEQLLPELEGAIADIERIFVSSETDMSQVDRSFVIATADYVTQLIFPRLLPILEAQAPGIKIQIVEFPADIQSRLQTGRINLVLAPIGILDEHRLNVTPVLEDELVVVASRNNPNIGDKLTRKTFIESGHVVQQPSVEIDQSFEIQTLINLDAVPRIVFRVPQFNLLPEIIENTNYLATIQRRLASKMVEQYNVRILESPVRYPRIKLAVLRNPVQDRDPVFAWLLEQITNIGQEINSTP
ncbi:LysR family transcriptional regulator [Pseudomaricurvus alkylphenolicus]|uniref:LysR family transcriptional regulator n=1 Tax=Pseudomaricurvus alkylphenolicus TaxID=1306991 RepID=UPI00141EEC44|nr:LysR family transcriptional regulator [Pseudomaricurvus alkylphenolicus]NIB42320.1 LysR family transcriptional regulator [Pseudomaricurvus alkylphenolicus]